MKRYFFTMAVFVMILMGCSNDSAFEGFADTSSYEAEIEKASIAIDDTDYDEAIATLTGLYNSSSPSPEVARILASAYMGKVGIDFTYLLDSIDDLGFDNFDSLSSMFVYDTIIYDEEEKEFTQCNADTLTVLLEEGDAKFISGYCIDDLIENLEDAKEVFDDMIETSLETDDDLVQMGITSAAHFIIIIGNTVADALNETLSKPNEEDQDPGGIPAPISKKAYIDYRFPDNDSYDWNNRYHWSRVDASIFEEIAEGEETTVLEQARQDIINVNNAIIALKRSGTISNDLDNELEQFLRDLLGVPTATITSDTINSHLSAELILTYIEGL